MTRIHFCGFALSLILAATCAAQCGPGVKGVEVTAIDPAQNHITLLCPGPN
jgi:hypothetical protein